MTLSEMKRILAEGAIQLSKSLGQNFLHDGNQLRRIVAAAELTNADRVLEIGPGLGPLTELLVARAGQVLAIEKDRRLFDFLRGQFAQISNLTLLHADALEYLVEERREWLDWKLVANLPYSVASPILVELAQMPSGPERMVVTLQLEVVHRLVAQAGEPDYGLLSLLVQLRYHAANWFRIPATCFHPPPEVASGCVTLLRRPQPLLGPEEAETFRRLVKRGFSERRKMMLKLLKREWPAARLEAAFAQAGLSAQARAESVGLEQFALLAQLVGRPSTDGPGNSKKS
jgi:16S rRNA (adenine1518-N6/adenine1519-N6)-dimethyltransferase